MLGTECDDLPIDHVHNLRIDFFTHSGSLRLKLSTLIPRLLEVYTSEIIRGTGFTKEPKGHSVPLLRIRNDYDRLLMLVQDPLETIFQIHFMIH